MKLEKNWFYYLCVSFSIVGMLYIIVCGFVSLGAAQEYPYYAKGLLLFGIFALWMLLQLTAIISARFRLPERLSESKKWIRILEAIIVILVLAAAFVIRLLVIWKVPMDPESDYKTYYEIAVLLKDGTIQKLGKGYCNYIAMFPHIMGYCYLLKTAFQIFGTSVMVGKYLNLFFATATVFFTYKIGRKLGGRITGMIALIACAFWPSQILYITMLSAEYAFTFFLFACIWLFLSLVKDYDYTTKKAIQAVVLHGVLGILIALTAAIRPMALILLFAIIICIFPQKMKMPDIPRNDIPLMLRLLEKGWLRCIIIIIPYMILSGIITTNIELTVDRTLPSSSESFGYNLLVGLNTDSIGGWNDADAKLLYDSMEKTGSAAQAHITCRDLAFTRLTSNPKGIINLFMNKYELLWGNDDYGTTWNIVFLKEQGNLTTERSDFLYKIKDYNDILYIVLIFFSIMAMIYAWGKEGSFSYILILLYLGTVAMHLFVESQNRYHYFVLQVFMILAAMGIQFIFREANEKADRIRVNEKRRLEQSEVVLQIEEPVKEEEVPVREMEEPIRAFNMQEALKKGHIIMTVTPSCAIDTETEEVTVPNKTDEDVVIDNSGE